MIIAQPGLAPRSPPGGRQVVFVCRHVCLVPRKALSRQVWCRERHVAVVEPGYTDDLWSLFSSRRWLAGRFAWVGGGSVGDLCSGGDLLCAASNPRFAGKPGFAGPDLCHKRRGGDMADMADVPKAPFAAP